MLIDARAVPRREPREAPLLGARSIRGIQGIRKGDHYIATTLGLEPRPSIGARVSLAAWRTGLVDF
jgi:hypothetical protein